jgi:2-polyprenyl-3-methyl-5-hydroxy-6-metoxy-1,4-benzoquinol methylase
MKRVSRIIRPEDTVLDVGCGSGRLLEFLPPSVRYVGVDVVDSLLNLGRQKYDRGRFIQADLNEVTPELGQFSTITLLAVIEHIPNPETFMKNLVRRYLNREGRLIITTPAPWGRRIHDLGAVIGLFSRHASEEHEEFLGRAELVNLSANLGFKMVLFKRFLFGLNQIACFMG